MSDVNTNPETACGPGAVGASDDTDPLRMDIGVMQQASEEHWDTQLTERARTLGFGACLDCTYFEPASIDQNKKGHLGDCTVGGRFIRVRSVSGADTRINATIPGKVMVKIGAYRTAAADCPDAPEVAAAIKNDPNVHSVRVWKRVYDVVTNREDTIRYRAGHKL